MRNYTKLLILLIFLAAGAAISCQSNSSGKSFAPTNTAEIQTYKATGVVKNTDADAGKITIDHEEIPGYAGEATGMTETVADAKMLEAVKPGDKIEFELQRTGSKLLITKLSKIGETAITNGGEIYKMNCAECHGDLGEGALQGISLLKGHALKHSEADYIKKVADGKEDKDKKMPPFKDKLTAEQIAAVVRFIREDLQKAASKDAKSDSRQ